VRRVVSGRDSVLFERSGKARVSLDIGLDTTRAKELEPTLVGIGTGAFTGRVRRRWRFGVETESLGDLGELVATSA